MCLKLGDNLFEGERFEFDVWESYDLAKINTSRYVALNKAKNLFFISHSFLPSISEIDSATRPTACQPI